VLYAVGAPGDRRLDIDGMGLPGTGSATEIVAWINGHPGFAGRARPIDERVLVRAALPGQGVGLRHQQAALGRAWRGAAGSLLSGRPAALSMNRRCQRKNGLRLVRVPLALIV
jgi:hypothetical protein